MVHFPPAKLNLGLFVTGRRPDGFHDLESVFVAIDWTDVLEVHVVEGRGALEVAYSGLAIPEGAPGSNLVERAHRELADAGFDLPSLRVRLHKVLPMGAGLGGGSADGTWMLRAIDEAAGLGLGPEGLRAHAEALGSDCPFFLEDGPAFVSGRGERIEPIRAGRPSWNGWSVAVVHPGVHVSTREAFDRLEVAPAPFNLRRLPDAPVERWHAEGVGNSFTNGVAALVPEVAEALAHVAEGATYTQLTGTGSAVFGLYASHEQAMRVADRAAVRGWTAWAGVLS